MCESRCETNAGYQLRCVKANAGYESRREANAGHQSRLAEANVEFN